MKTTTSIACSCTSILEEAGVSYTRVYDLRHTCATILLMAGKHPKYVQELPSRASISITLDTDSHVIEVMAGWPLLWTRRYDGGALGGWGTFSALCR